MTILRSQGGRLYSVHRTFRRLGEPMMTALVRWCGTGEDLDALQSEIQRVRKEGRRDGQSHDADPVCGVGLVVVSLLVKVTLVRAGAIARTARQARRPATRHLASALGRSDFLGATAHTCGPVPIPVAGQLGHYVFNRECHGS